MQRHAQNNYENDKYCYILDDDIQLEALAGEIMSKHKGRKDTGYTIYSRLFFPTAFELRSKNKVIQLTYLNNYSNNIRIHTIRLLFNQIKICFHQICLELLDEIPKIIFAYLII
ncbi:hypothetical protein TTHERM_000637208 (macronuclear) [Tetrahymena thermophila SB210]|uniref:Uncharacterized protein n=1 Tax=Tetrahymena thermophila (strain SB210) TaxID=312017 RepID=W7X6C8_TETTS|nr:hypothetical protein TTHERM_000637208 [Tetrahymena thermophila SB210]EWS72962.1 hypothetical protein TTHERM_000637208 [Tetrahymena thermophila SB210]|eukprot:XP_012654495.1 hypothetical protein TTHERM_000637208 [Tetrahymena thermophila SB210]